MAIRDRIKELRRVRAGSLRPNPRNWRTHPPAQREALRGLLAEIGYADALVARELPDGSLELVDGHLRAELAPEQMVPVLVLDVSQEEALKLLATLDPLAAMAEADAAMLHKLIEDVTTNDRSVAALLKSLAREHPLPGAERSLAVTIPATFQVIVECADEEQQRRLFEQLTTEGFKCRVLTL
jgi:ParB-like chromosome segregation protein Spo0J